MEFTNLKTYNTEPEAEIFRVFLEENGIEGFIFNTNSSTIYPMLNNTIGGFALKVRTENLEEAQKLLEEFYAENDEIDDEDFENL